MCVHTLTQQQPRPFPPQRNGRRCGPAWRLVPAAFLVAVIKKKKYLTSATKDGRVGLGSRCESSVHHNGEVTEGGIDGQQAEWGRTGLSCLLFIW